MGYMVKAVKVFCRIEYVAEDLEGNIVLSLSKKTGREKAISLLRQLIGEDVSLMVRSIRDEGI